MHIHTTEAEDRSLFVIILVYLLEAKRSCTCMGSLTCGKHWIAKSKAQHSMWLCLQGGHLRQALTNSSDGELKWDKKGATIALDIVRGLHFLHSHGVSHYSFCTLMILCH